MPKLVLPSEITVVYVNCMHARDWLGTGSIGSTRITSRWKRSKRGFVRNETGHVSVKSSWWGENVTAAESFYSAIRILYTNVYRFGFSFFFRDTRWVEWNAYRWGHVIYENQAYSSIFLNPWVNLICSNKLMVIHSFALDGFFYFFNCKCMRLFIFSFFFIC